MVRLFTGTITPRDKYGLQAFEAMPVGVTTTVAGSTFAGDTKLRDDLAAFNQR